MKWEPAPHGGWRLMNGPHNRVAWIAEHTEDIKKLEEM